LIVEPGLPDPGAGNPVTSRQYPVAGPSFLSRESEKKRYLFSMKTASWTKNKNSWAQARSVTGSKHLLEIDKKKILVIVGCFRAKKRVALAQLGQTSY